MRALKERLLWVLLACHGLTARTHKVIKKDFGELITWVAWWTFCNSMPAWTSLSGYYYEIPWQVETCICIGTYRFPEVRAAEAYATWDV